MYGKFFGIQQPPFDNTPDPDFFYETPAHEEALASLMYGVTQRKGFVLLTGEVGAGKTLIGRMLLAKLGNRAATATISHTGLPGCDLLAAICTALEVRGTDNCSGDTKVKKLQDYLLSEYAKSRPVVLIIDEAQNLSTDDFEQLRVIGNLEADRAKLLQVIILGQPELQRLCALPIMEQLRQRIFRIFHLPGLSFAQTDGYIHHRLRIAGATDTEIFEPSAIRAVYEYSRGIPRLINQACDNALISSYASDVKHIDAELINVVITQMLTLRATEPAGDDAESSADAAVGQVFQPNAPLQESAAQAEQSNETLHEFERRLAGVERQFQGFTTLIESSQASTNKFQERMNDVTTEWQTAAAEREQLNRSLAKSRTLGDTVAKMGEDLTNIIAECRQCHQEAHDLATNVMNKLRRVEEPQRMLERSGALLAGRVRESINVVRNIATISGAAKRHVAVLDRQTKRSEALAAEIETLFNRVDERVALFETQCRQAADLWNMLPSIDTSGAEQRAQAHEIVVADARPDQPDDMDGPDVASAASTRKRLSSDALAAKLNALARSIRDTGKSPQQVNQPTVAAQAP